MRNRLAVLTAALLALLTLGGSMAYANTGRNVNGIHWEQQQQTATPIDDPVTILDQAVVLVATPGNTYNTSLLDVRPYNSYGLRLKAEDGTYTATDQLQVDITFYSDATGTTPLFTDSYVIFKTNILGSSQVKLVSTMLAGWMKITVSDPNATGRNFNLSFTLVGSWRALSNTYLRTEATGMLYTRSASLAAAATDAIPAKLGYGRAMATLLSGAGGGATMEIRIGGTTANSTVYVLTAGAANTRVNMEIVLPRQQAYVVLTNTGGALSTIRGWIIQQVDPY